jgi:hypothetical protein
MEFSTIIKGLVEQNSRIAIHQGKVTAVSTSSVSLQLSGDTTILTGIKYFDSYVPVVNDIVFVLINAGDLIVIDKVASGRHAAFRAHNTGGTHTTNTGVILDFNATSLNRGGAFNTSTYQFTAPIAGIYAFNFQVYTQNGAAIKSIAWRKNSSELVSSDTDISFQSATNIGDVTLSGSNLLELAVSDTVDIAVRSAGSANLQWYGGHSRFSGHFVMP